jgi:hypothetical protein
VPRLYVPIADEHFRRLADLAWRERRSPQDQAALLIMAEVDRPPRRPRRGRYVRPRVNR